jgi:hypothetical protein
MNCEEYKQAITEDPSFDGGAGHISECADCQAYRKDLLALDRTIAAALAIDVPELSMPELPETESAKVVTLGPRRKAAPAWLALAATVVIAAVVGFRMLGTDVLHDSLAEEILAHLDHEPAALVVTDKAVSDRRLNAVVPTNVSILGHSAGLVTYAMTCTINGKEVPHLVVQGQRGPVTILLMPDEMIDSAVDLSGEHTTGVLLPVGKGSIAIIGNREEVIEPITNSVLKSVAWET